MCLFRIRRSENTFKSNNFGCSAIIEFTLAFPICFGDNNPAKVAGGRISLRTPLSITNLFVVVGEIVRAGKPNLLSFPNNNYDFVMFI